MLYRALGRFFARLFPQHRARGYHRALRWQPCDPHEAHLAGAQDLADLERRMRTWINGW